MIGLKRGAVRLSAHQDEWDKNAETVIGALKRVLGNAAVDIQHIGSTAVSSIHAKPVIDIVVGVRDLQDIMPYAAILEENGVIYRGEDVSGQVLFVMGDFESDWRTHHIHVVKWNETAWNDYINFRDYLNAFPAKAAKYDACKQKLALQFSEDRRRYTQGKQKLIERFLEEAKIWKANQ